jgi:fused signal recognition particle receptor
MGLFSTFKKWFQQPEWTEESLEDFKTSLLLADTGVVTTDSIVQYLKKHYPKQEMINQEIIVDQLISWFNTKTKQRLLQQGTPSIYLIVGVNGVGKTTFIAKFAKYLQTQGQIVSLIAGDTFRAGAVEQLFTWGSRLGIEVFKGQEGSDPASVVFDGISKSSTDVILIDTAGRLQNKVQLMNELVKIKRVIQKAVPEAPHETLLVLDATTGQNGLEQAKVFTDEVGVTGVVLSKWDGIAKGGFLLSVVNQLHLPIFYVGVGEQLDDLVEFDTSSFLKRIGGLG